MDNKLINPKPQLEQSCFYFDHKHIETLKPFINQFGQIEARHRIINSRHRPVLRAYQQKQLSQAIKRARFLGLLPYMSHGDIN